MFNSESTGSTFIFCLFMEFSTLSAAMTDDRDKKVYKTVKIGKQTWMSENLNYSDAGRVGKCYDNKPSNCEIYGRLYDWETAKEICPKGWHLPSYDEWKNLYRHIGSEDYYDREVEIKLKAASGWKIGGRLNNSNGTDDYGFTALPGGHSWCRPVHYRGKLVDCVYEFIMLGIKGSWWTATKEYDIPIHWLIDHSAQYSFSYVKMWFMSVRCVKD